MLIRFKHLSEIFLFILTDAYDLGKYAMDTGSAKIDLMKQKAIVLIGVSNVSNNPVTTDITLLF